MLITFISRKVFAVVENRSELDPLDFLVAGPSVLFMVIDIFLYWGVLYTLERGVWRNLARRVSKSVEERQRRRRLQRGMQQEEVMQSMIEDEDIVEEEQKVAQT